MSKFRLYARTGTTLMRDAEPEDALNDEISISEEDAELYANNRDEFLRGKIATDGKSSWYINREYFEENYNLVPQNWVP